MSGLTITYAIDADEWERTRLMRRVPHSEPLFHAFNGVVEVSVDGKVLDGFPYHMCVSDLACGIATLIAEGFPSSSEATFRQGDDSMILRFRRVGPRIEVVADGAGLEMSADEFWVGIDAFVSSFIRDLLSHVESPFDWGDLRVLAELPQLLRRARGSTA